MEAGSRNQYFDRLCLEASKVLDNLLEAMSLEATKEQSIKFWLAVSGFLLLTRIKFSL
jgi:hypothetical protein